MARSRNPWPTDGRPARRLHRAIVHPRRHDAARVPRRHRTRGHRDPRDARHHARGRRLRPARRRRRVHRVCCRRCFGEPGQPMSVPATAWTPWSAPASRRSSRRFALDAHEPDHGVAPRARAADARRSAAGPGVGAVGMCFTGGFALAMMVDDVVLAPVLSQPSLPLPLGKKHRPTSGSATPTSPGSRSASPRARACSGCASPATRSCPAERFETPAPRARRRVHRGRDRLVARQPVGHQKRAHSVLTNDLVDEPGHPTRDALDQVLTFFSERLRPEPE